VIKLREPRQIARALRAPAPAASCVSEHQPHSRMGGSEATSGPSGELCRRGVS
jgi:hypothetical protein